MLVCRTLLLIVDACLGPWIKRCVCTYVPKHEIASEKDVRLLQSFVFSFPHLFVLTGAGVSTESGIPDYRSKGVGLYARSSHKPVTFRDFMSYEIVRRRYWVRNYVGWPKFCSLEPNVTHICLKTWEDAGLVNWLITQNVDRLHHKAGSEKVIELHGTSYRVKCLNCQYSFSRYLFQSILQRMNPGFMAHALEIRPDGDVELEPSLANDFMIPSCERCGGILKPDVVFFGETVPLYQVQDIYEKVAVSDAIVVLGSSLEVFSGYRFILAAAEYKKPIGIVNIGPTRADNLATLRLNCRCGDVLSRIKM